MHHNIRQSILTLPNTIAADVELVQNKKKYTFHSINKDILVARLKSTTYKPATPFMRTETIFSDSVDPARLFT